MRNKALDIAVLLIIAFSSSMAHRAIAQSSPNRWGQAEWSPDGRFIAIFNTDPIVNTVEVFTADLVPVATLQLENFPSDFTQADGESWRGVLIVPLWRRPSTVGNELRSFARTQRYGMHNPGERRSH
jgi:hypothetical protein